MNQGLVELTLTFAASVASFDQGEGIKTSPLPTPKNGERRSSAGAYTNTTMEGQHEDTRHRSTRGNPSHRNRIPQPGSKHRGLEDNHRHRASWQCRRRYPRTRAALLDA